MASTNFRSDALVLADAKPFKCDLCPAMFKLPSDLRAHISILHSTGSRFRCSQCPATFKTNSCLRRHHSVHRNAALLTCSYCSKAFKSTDTLVKHQDAQHVTVKPYKCDLCPARFRNSDGARKHRDQFHFGKMEKPFKCCICLKAFKLWTGLKEHLAVHSSERRYKCQHCSASYKFSGGLREHFAGAHSRGRVSFGCAQCLRSFDNKRRLISHVLWLHERAEKMRFTCKRCALRCEVDQRAIDAILQTSESDAKLRFNCPKCSALLPYACFLSVKSANEAAKPQPRCCICELKLKNKDSLARHIITIHKHFTALPYGYHCDFCNAKFRWNFQLNQHMFKTHYGKIRQFDCAICPEKKFRVKKSLVRHLRLHSGTPRAFCKNCCTPLCGKQHPSGRCEACTARRARLSIRCAKCLMKHSCRAFLISHLRVHTDSDGVSCRWCYARFKTNVALIMHTKIVHSVKGRKKKS